MTRRCLILILCGIPGVGKSTFASNLLAKLRTTVQTWVCFDDIIPHDGLDVGSVVSDPNREATYHGIWKEYRLQILETIDDIISKVITDSVQQFAELTELDSEDGAVSKHVKKAVRTWFKSSLIKSECGNHASGERNEMENVAHGDNISFCQIHIHCPLDVALERNRSRNTSVPDDTVIGMATRFEPPDDSEGSWEEMSLQIDGSKEFSDDTWTAVLSLVHKALTRPVQPMPVDDPQEKEQSRLSCLRSIIHQGDQVLRRLISERMKVSKETGMPKAEMKLRSEKLNQGRQTILKSLRDGTLTPLASDATGEPDELQTFLQKCLDDHMS